MAKEKQRYKRKIRARPLILGALAAFCLLAFLTIELAGGAGWDRLNRLLGNETHLPPVMETTVPDGAAKIHFIDVGQGDCILLECDGAFAIIDAGDADAWDSIRSYLLELDVEQLEYAFISHIHADHTGSMNKLLKEFPVGQMILPDGEKGPEPTTFSYEKILTTLAEKSIDTTVAAVGESYALGGGTITVLGNGVPTDNQNDISTALRFAAGDFVFLTTGDGEKAVEQDLMERKTALKADLFKAAHHGSSTSNSAEFLKKVKPQIVVASCGQNNDYGHPHRETAENCKAVGAQLLRTDTMGSIIVWKQDGRLHYSSSREAA